MEENYQLIWDLWITDVQVVPYGSHQTCILMEVFHWATGNYCILTGLDVQL